MRNKNSFILFAFLMSCFMSLAWAGPKEKQSAGIFAPYKDASLNANWQSTPPKMQDMSSAYKPASEGGAGLRAVTLGFVVAEDGCNAVIANKYMPVSSGYGKDQIQNLQKHGVKVIMSFGGAGGTYLSSACPTVDALYEQYKKVAETYNVYDFDMDYENNSAGQDKMIGALKKLAEKYPKLKVSFTLSAAPGVIKNSDVVINAAKNGVPVDFMNLMAFDYGGATVDSIKSLMSSPTAMGVLKEAFPGLSDQQLYSKLGMTLMIGRDDMGNQLTVAGAKRLAFWAKQKGMHFVSFWSYDRDKPCNSFFAPIGAKYFNPMSGDFSVFSSPECSGSTDQTSQFEYSQAISSKFID